MMSSLPRREQLEAMKRVDIQKICKDYGVRANLKTEALIDMILDASQPLSTRNPPATRQRSTSARPPSRSSSRPRGRSGGSVIIHDIDYEDESEGQQPEPMPIDPPPPTEPQPPRTRKAKDTQYRLGVGRPAAAGGKGARAVTKSLSVTKNNRGKSSRSVQPTEATIMEEEQESAEAEIVDPVVLAPVDLSQGVAPHSGSQTAVQGTQNMNSDASPQSDAIRRAISEALMPTKNELDELKSQMAAMVESFEAKIRSLSAEIEDLRSQIPGKSTLGINMNHFEEIMAAARRGLDAATNTSALHSSKHSMRTSAHEHNEQSIAGPSGSNSVTQASPLKSGRDASSTPQLPSTTLGKRHRDSTTSNITGVFEAGREDELTEKELEKLVARPAQKRAKTQGDDEADDQREGSSSSGLPSGKDKAQIFHTPHNPTLPERRSPDDYIDLPPPNEPLPRRFGSLSPPPISGLAPISLDSLEGQNPFSYAFLPIASTPLYPMTLPGFPYPEPPQSPTPSNNPERPGTERFHPFLFPRAASSSSSKTAVGSTTIQTEDGGKRDSTTSQASKLSSNEVASAMGLTAIKTGSDTGQAIPPAKRTMYGTELDGDTRFGDFGVEGVATGFWSSGRF